MDTLLPESPLGKLIRLPIGVPLVIFGAQLLYVPIDFYFMRRGSGAISSLRQSFSTNAPVPPEHALHQHLLAARSSFPLEEDRLHVFAADFTDEADAGMELVHGSRDGDDFLHRFASDQGAMMPAPEP